jgi:hypothetical protein
VWPVLSNPHSVDQGKCYDYSQSTNRSGQPAPAMPRSVGGGGLAMATPRTLVIDENRNSSWPYVSDWYVVRSAAESTAHPAGLVYVLAPLRKAATA